MPFLIGQWSKTSTHSMWLTHVVAPTVSGTVVSAVGEGHLRGASSGPDQGPSNRVGGSLTT